MHVEIQRSRDATDGMVKLSDVYYQTERILSIFFERFNQQQLIHVFFQQLTCNVIFFLLKSFC